MVRRSMLSHRCVCVALLAAWLLVSVVDGHWHPAYARSYAGRGAPVNASPAPLEEPLEQAKAAYRAGNYRGAVDLLRPMLKAGAAERLKEGEGSATSSSDAGSNESNNRAQGKLLEEGARPHFEISLDDVQLAPLDPDDALLRALEQEQDQPAPDSLRRLLHAPEMVKYLLSLFEKEGSTRTLEFGVLLAKVLLSCLPSCCVRRF
jgi:hypothetical protein